MKCICGSTTFVFPVRGKVEINFKTKKQDIRALETMYSTPITCCECNRTFILNLDKEYEELDEVLQEVFDLDFDNTKPSKKKRSKKK